MASNKGCKKQCKQKLKPSKPWSWVLSCVLVSCCDCNIMYSSVFLVVMTHHIPPQRIVFWSTKLCCTKDFQHTTLQYTRHQRINTTKSSPILNKTNNIEDTNTPHIQRQCRIESSTCQPVSSSVFQHLPTNHSKPTCVSQQCWNQRPSSLNLWVDRDSWWRGWHGYTD